MKLFVIQSCEACDAAKAAAAGRDDVQSVECYQTQADGPWMYNDGMEAKEAPLKGRGFPYLYVGDSDGKPNFLVGKEGIEGYLKNGFVYAADARWCPHFQGSCKEKACVKFTTLFKGLIAEGACSDYFIPVLMTELMSKISGR